MRRLGILALLAAALSFLVDAANTKSELGGVWVVKRTKDDIKARSPNHVLRIQQNGGRLVVIEISQNDNTKAVWSRGCNLDARSGRSVVLRCDGRRETWTLS